ncbi:hypothetical protein NliqN6_6351 [Naganishia liquefaciens]|uniref:Major facilitator superfamily (MFS) profile domain-containing protein n=1 Tax=Naganishia liquefaciens TaxID=104408 RepID=A0A8H3YHJ3_9TREE|nr:hypothetical protein NliqN6_6351 [Naganishia liquefaciens]
MSGQEQETQGLVANGSASIRYDGSSPNDIQPSAQANRDRFDDAHLAMLDPDSLSTGRKRLFVAGMILASFLAALDLTVVATCMPTISSELQSSDREAWIGTAYLWSTVTFTPLYGLFANFIGRRVAYLSALALFTAGTLLCGLASSLPVLAAARFFAGMGGGGIGTVSSIITSDLFHVRDRAFYQGLGFIGFGAGMGLGGPIGGYLTRVAGWRSAFYVQIPPAVILIGLGVWLLPAGKARAKHSLRDWCTGIDIGGAAALLVSIGAFLQYLSLSSSIQSTQHQATTTLALVIAAFSFLVFIYVELRIAHRPILPLYLLKQRNSLCIGLIAGMVAIVNFNMVYHLSMLFEIAFQQTVSLAGAHLLPNSICLIIAGPVVGYLIKRTNRYKWVTSICCLGPVASMFLLARMTPATPTWLQWIAIVPMGCGFSGLLTSTLVGIMNQVDRSQAAIATGFVFMFRSLGQVSGVGLSSAIFQASLNRELVARFPSPKIIDKLRHASSAIADLPDAWSRQQAREAYQAALHQTFAFGCAIAIGMLLVSLAIPNSPLRTETNTCKATSHGQKPAEGDV